MYCTFDDIADMLPEERLIELTDDDNTGTVDQGRIDAAIEAAQGEVNGYLAERYTVPLVATPPLIKSITVDFAIYRLYGRNYDEIPETRQKRYDNGVILLRKIADGTISLGIADPPATENSDAIHVTAPEPLFPTDELDRY